MIRRSVSAAVVLAAVVALGFSQGELASADPMTTPGAAQPSDLIAGPGDMPLPMRPPLDMDALKVATEAIAGQLSVTDGLWIALLPSGLAISYPALDANGAVIEGYAPYTQRAHELVAAAASVSGATGIPVSYKAFQGFPQDY